MTPLEKSNLFEDFMIHPDKRTLEGYEEGFTITKLPATETEGSKELNVRAFEVKSKFYKTVVPFGPAYITRINNAILRHKNKSRWF